MRRLFAKSAPRRWLGVVLTPVLLVCGCHGPSCSANTSAAIPSPAPNKLCTEMGGAWDAKPGRCTLTRDGGNGVHVEVMATYPVDLVDNPTAGPVLGSFVRKFFTDCSQTDANGGGAPTSRIRRSHIIGTPKLWFSSLIGNSATCRTRAGRSPHSPSTSTRASSFNGHRFHVEQFEPNQTQSWPTITRHVRWTVTTSSSTCRRDVAPVAFPRFHHPSCSAG
jgi:hypothetical protein